ncbi:MULTISPECIES: TRAP transporter large permease [unclassified Marinobacterium]|jgi:tripartite ATP-independent transporter DctM subunit|uniref:TRAP transporter large permease n=1 Tax=unclassified Marinobacterium TaxID=2644139 RepID=UPI0015680652|nr:MULTISPECIES: TRAP transporter large permease [unclassified Marinobacterium]NRP09270.1 Sialic acid TRAP transporter permease protein SiaT [Marinobacterium sp. xm-g-48]NRP15324.1 Sialic acid TRAP transporter permease protein SiaT [Marinobacterium sp. xm-a-152]NRP26609.1 Sialic acid TRAP transporter permease protein SiaT [Marinobacterium sp. xm-d-420]NRP35636.1 Sialic acid TRAP transporter permease protein SiaT [Marinobacterium sp. xm-d-579]NRP37616.1 Sialic acid TRAP transporter permease pro
MTAVIIGFALLIFLILVIRMPIAFAMAIVGFFGFAILQGLTLDNLFDFRWKASLTLASNRVIETAQEYSLSVVPLFILMGNFVTRSGLSQELYNAAYTFLGHRRGGLAMSTVVACGGFSAICGSSLATSATMAKVALPPMRKFGYADSLATASIAAGGTLGILIPPSVILVIYGLLTETSIRELFAAGFIPGLLGVILYMLAVRWVVMRNPKSGPAGEKFTWAERMQALKGIWGVLLLFTIVMGGIYLGVFTPTEAAGIGAAGAFLIALLRGQLNLVKTYEVLSDTVRTSTMLFAVIIGALIFSDFINRAGLPVWLLEFVQSLDVSPMAVIIVILCIYILLGMVFESLSMLLLTVPVFYPLIDSLGFDLVWYGIVVVVVTEISLITPPVGMNVFVLSAVLKDIKTGTIFKGVTPFWCADIVRLALIVAFVPITLFLPDLLYR